MMKLKKAFLFELFLLPVFIFFISCERSGSVKVRVSDTGNFPRIEISHVYGEDLVIQPVSDTIGSFGIETDGQIYWVTGDPDQTERSGKTVSFTWDIPDDEKVELTVTEGNDKTEFQFRLITGENIERYGKWHLHIGALDTEFYTGVFERVVDGPQHNSWRKGIETALNLRNERIEMKVKPTVSAYAPFYVSSNNYGLFVKGTWPGLFDFCQEFPDIVQVVFEGTSMEFGLYLGPSPKEIVQAHALETGPSFVPPRWAFGPWRWRDDHANRPAYYDGSEVKAPFNSDVTEDILMMEAHDIPCTAYWIDRPWGPGGFGFDDYEIDSSRLPNFEEMISWLNEKEIEVMLWICPWVYGHMAEVAKERGYGLVGRTMRGPPRPITDERLRARFMEFRRQMENMVVMDFTNQEALGWWADNGPAKLARMGIKGFKLDRGDGERLVDSLHLTTSSGITYRENYNDYGRQFVKAAYDAVSPVLGSDFILFPRVQYTGSARYGGMWAGDTDNSAEGLRSALIAMQRCAVMGYPVWGSDAGGYPKRMEREVTLRWLGFACFSPVMEVGPTNNRGFWGMDSEPSYDKDLMAAWRFYSKLRMSLVDYIHDLARIASETGMPIIRPLFIEYADQEESWKDWKTYKMGDDLLISVIWEKGKTVQTVYLPEGETWIDLWNNKEYSGGNYIELDAPLYQTPVFLRKGSDLELPDLNQLYRESVEITSVIHQMSDLEAGEGWR